MTVIWQIIMNLMASFLKGWWSHHEHDEKLQEIKHVQDTINSASDDDISKRLHDKYTRSD